MKVGQRRAYIAIVATVAACLALIPATPALASDYSQISAGADHTCALTPTGKAYCWGSDSYGQLGDGGSTDQSTPVAVLGGLTFTTITAGYNHTCGLISGGAAYCWGRQTNGRLGNGQVSTASINTPQLVVGSHSFTSISAGYENTCGVSSSTAYCWGRGNSGTNGNGTISQIGTPTAISGSYTIASISVGRKQACAVTNLGIGYCWGGDSFGELGDNGTTDQLSPVAIAGGLTFSKIIAGWTHSCGITTSQDTYCWGDNTNGQLGDGTQTQSSVPIHVTGHTFATVITGQLFTCATTSDGQLYCWGYNQFGQFGNGSRTNSLTPIASASNFRWVQMDITSSAQHVCGLTQSNVALCMGENAHGKLGNASSVDSYVAVAVASVSGNTVDVIISPSFTFSVGAHAGNCNGVAQTAGTSTSATAVSFGHVASSSTAVAAQDVTVMSNAAGGFTVYVKSVGTLGVIDDVSGSNISPVSFPSPGTEAFGYTTSDSTLGTGVANRFTSGGAKWAAFTTSSAEVSYASGTTVSDTQCIASQVGISPATTAGTYSTTVIYTAVPVF